ncbi:MAG: hypothetical protein AAGH53_09755 [Pseudomonadota bacterium]
MAPAAESSAPRALPTLPEDWRDWPLLKGRWSYEWVYDGAQRNDRGDSYANFTDEDGVKSTFISCQPDEKRIVFSVGASERPDNFSIRTTFNNTVLNSSYTQQTASVERPAASVIWDEIIYSRGSFAVRLGQGRGVRLPTAPEIARVVEDCRS